MHPMTSRDGHLSQLVAGGGYLWTLPGGSHEFPEGCLIIMREANPLKSDVWSNCVVCTEILEFFTLDLSVRLSDRF